jgi:hypothetical protein
MAPVEARSVVDDLDLQDWDEGRGTHGYVLSRTHRIGEGLTDLRTQHPQLLTQHPRDLLNQQGIHSVQLDFGAVELGLGGEIFSKD